jgi:hypothetical protein
MRDSGVALGAERRRIAAMWLGSLSCCGSVVIASFVWFSLSLMVPSARGRSIDYRFIPSFLNSGTYGGQIP